MMIEMPEIKKQVKFKFADNTLCHRSGDSKRTCKKKSRKPTKRRKKKSRKPVKKKSRKPVKKKSRKPKKRRKKRGSRKVVNLPLKKRFRMKKVPSDLKKVIARLIPKREGVGRFATVNKHTLRASKEELERRRFHATNETLWGAVREYLEDKRSAKRKYGNISGWDVSEVTDMSFMFAHAYSFNGDLSGWDVSNVTDMRYMFQKAKSFNGDLSKWNVSNVTNMERMFAGAKKFDGDISKWNVSNVTNMRSMFYEAKSFDKKNAPWYPWSLAAVMLKMGI